tara:strand:+ start:7714 stop:8040 length:327 start_codon:yes stop_codon:yes gene_type:complete
MLYSIGDVCITSVNNDELNNYSPELLLEQYQIASNTICRYYNKCKENKIDIDLVIVTGFYISDKLLNDKHFDILTILEIFDERIKPQDVFNMELKMLDSIVYINKYLS